MENTSKNWIILLLVVGLFWATFIHEKKYEGYTASEWYTEYEQTLNEYYNLEEEKTTLEDMLIDYQDALSQANDNIEEAKLSTWMSYEDMGDALDYLEIVDEPY